MIVLDASIVVELITQGPRAEVVMRALAEHDETYHAPHLLDVEVLSAMRGLCAAFRIDERRGKLAIARLKELPVERVPHTGILERVWELRHNFSAYDACYIALAEATGSTLFTCDAKLKKGHKAKVRVFA